MPKKSRFLAVALTAALLWGCGRISDLTYEKAAEFEGITFPPLSGSSAAGTSSSASTSSSQPSAAGADFTDGGFYYDNLSADAQDNYRLLLEGFMNFEPEIGGLSEESTIVFAAAHAVYLDHPELTWLQNGGGQLTYGNGEGVFAPVYLMDTSEGLATAAQAKAAADSFLSGVDPSVSDYEKTLAVFDYLVDTVDYSEADTNCRDIYGTLVERQAVCAGYAVTAKYLLDRLDVPCITVTGNVLAEGQPHAWNIVWIDGEPYHMDVTWGDPSFADDFSAPDGYRNYSYLLLTTDEILSERFIDKDVCELPVCTSEYDYFLREGLFLETYSDALGEILVSAYTAGDSWVTVAFDDSVSMDDVVYRLFECGDYYAFFNKAGISLGSSSYSVKESVNSLTVFFQN